MSNPRPHSTSKDVTAEVMEDFDRQSSLLRSIFPDTPLFTVVLAVSFPHEEEDVEAERDGLEGPPVLDCCTLHVRAVNVHTAIDIAMAETSRGIYDEMGDDTVFTLLVAGAFIGNVVDLAEDYDYEKSAFYSPENAMEDYNGVAA
jgi:hypothetical protein